MPSKIHAHFTCAALSLFIAAATAFMPAQAEPFPIGGTVSAIDTVRGTVTIGETTYTLSPQLKILNADVDGQPEADITIIQAGKYIEIEVRGRVIYLMRVYSQIPS